MTRAWTIEPYRTRLVAAIEHERWDEVDRLRVAVKRRLLELVARGAAEQEIAEARDLLASCFDKLRLSKKLRIEQGPLTSASRFLADAETAGIAFELAPMPAETARDTGERILQVLSKGNQMPQTTGELASEIGRSLETVSRSLSKLRAEGKILSRRNGRHVNHRIVGAGLFDYKNNVETNYLIVENIPSLLVKAWVDEAVRISPDASSRPTVENVELHKSNKRLFPAIHLDIDRDSYRSAIEAEDVGNSTAPNNPKRSNSDIRVSILAKYSAAP